MDSLYTQGHQFWMARPATKLRVRPKTGAVGKPDLGRNSPKRSPAVEDKLLEVISNGWSVSKAAAEAGIGRVSAFNWRDDAKQERERLNIDDPSYREKFDINFFTRWEHAMEAGVDKLEDEASRRATGYEEPVFGKDGIVGHRTLYSDPLMMMIMKGKRPNRYGIDRKEISGPNGTPIPHVVEVEFVTPSKKVK